MLVGQISSGENFAGQSFNFSHIIKSFGFSFCQTKENIKLIFIQGITFTHFTNLNYFNLYTEEFFKLYKKEFT